MAKASLFTVIISHLELKISILSEKEINDHFFFIE